MHFMSIEYRIALVRLSLWLWRWKRRVRKERHPVELVEQLSSKAADIAKSTGKPCAE